MPSHVFRFRSIKALLGEHQELERQEIYFAATDELNDPMEGYLDVEWRGDEILWTNFLRQYLLCIIQGAATAQIAPAFEVESYRNLVWHSPQDIIAMPLASLHEEFCDEIVRSPIGKNFIARMNALQRPVGRDELIVHMNALHSRVFPAMLRMLIRRKLLPESFFSGSDAVDTPGSDKHMDELVKLTKLDSDFARSSFEIALVMAIQLNLIHEYRMVKNNLLTKGWRFLALNFPSFYVNSLESLVYPRWRVACFVEDPNNASMWGVYGDAHRGACLKFRTIDENGAPSLKLNMHTGWHGDKSGEVRSMTCDVSLQFKRVQYGESRPVVEFFSSLGTIANFKLRDWTASAEGKVSEFAKDIGTEEWRKSYWERFDASLAAKTLEWAHEKEQRLVFSSLLENQVPRERAKGVYDFADLSGIVFGYRTPDEEKIAIIRVIEGKCRASGRRDFEFLQTRYARDGSIRAFPLSLLRFNAN